MFIFSFLFFSLMEVYKMVYFDIIILAIQGFHKLRNHKGDFFYQLSTEIYLI